MATSDDDDGSSGGGGGVGTLLKQTLMSHLECFVYKVPPLATAAGYRANDWDLAAPLETCGFQVERRNNDLYLLFTLENHTKLFALSKIEGESEAGVSGINVETVLDSSRYFVCRILQSSGGKKRTALLGFGFREREIAIDLLGNLQQFRQSIDRELEAKDLASKTKSIPVLAEGEKLHIRIPGGKGGEKKSTRVRSSGGASSSKPMLLKKPPPGADEVSVEGGTTPTSSGMPSPMLSPYRGGKRFSMSAMECPLKTMTLNIASNHATISEDAGDDEGAGDDDDDSNAALAHSIVDDLGSLDDDDEFDCDVGAIGNDSRDGGDDDDASNDAVGGITVDGGTSLGSLAFGDLNLDDPPTGDDAAPVTTTTPPSAEDDDDDDFGDFQGA